jgi:integrase
MKFFSENHSGHVNIDSGTGSFFHPFQTGIIFTSRRNPYSHHSGTIIHMPRNPHWVFSTENSKRPLTRDFVWTKRMLPYLKPIGLDWATFQVMRRTHASRSKEAGVDAHTRSAQMGNTVDVNENEYAVSDFKTRREAVRKLEAALTVKAKDNGECSE